MLLEAVETGPDHLGRQRVEQDVRHVAERTLERLSLLMIDVGDDEEKLVVVETSDGGARPGRTPLCWADMIATGQNPMMFPCRGLPNCSPSGRKFSTTRRGR